MPVLAGWEPLPLPRKEEGVLELAGWEPLLVADVVDIEAPPDAVADAAGIDGDCGFAEQSLLSVIEILRPMESNYNLLPRFEQFEFKGSPPSNWPLSVKYCDQTRDAVSVIMSASRSRWLVRPRRRAIGSCLCLGYLLQCNTQ